MIIFNKLNKYKLHVCLFLFIFIFLSYFLMTGGNFWEYDSFASYKLSKNMVDRGNFQIDCFWGEKGLSGQCYSKYGVFMSVAIIPFYLLEKIFLEFFKSKFFYAGFFPSLANCFITALLAVLIFKYLSKMNFSKKISIAGAMLFSFATFAPVYTKTLFAEPLLALLIYLCLYLLFFKDRVFFIFLAGLCFGLALLTKITAIIILPVLLYIIFYKKTNFKKLIIFFLPFLFSLLIFFIYNFSRFGNILNSGYSGINFNNSLFKGLYLFILSPGKSFVLYLYSFTI